MRIGLFVLLALLPACGGSGEPEAPQAPPIEIHSVEGTLTTRTASPFEIHGVSFPGVIWTVVTICFDALEGTPLDGCRSATTEVSGVVRSSTLLQAQSPITELAGDTACRVTVSFPDGTVISSAGAIATLLGHADIRYDHDLDGEHDRCDPDTYDFEDDGIGERPAGTQRVDGDSPGFGVVDSGGDRAANYALATATGMHDTLDRLRCDVSHQDLTVFVDFDDTPQFAHVELWSDGSYLGNAGAGLLFQVQPNGALRLWQRIRRGLSSQAAGTLPASGRLRLRLAKGAGDASTLHVDTWEADMWSVDHAVFPIADDRWFTGREIALGEYGNSTRGIRRITAHRQGPPAALTIAECASTSASWKVFQRDATEAATIPVDCLYRLAAPGRLEARVVSAGTTDVLPGHDWADHALALAAAEDGRTQLPITDVPTGGNYDIEMRLVDTATDAVLGTDTLVEVAVGDLYLCIGQSNMAGYSHSLAGATPPLPQVHMFANSDTWMQAEEPVDNSLFQRDGVSAENPAHSLRLPFAA
ncbi:MAG: sialate O-acetylesterase, partial [Planctomycetota bacterium]|nr:sialate O-acetylesterase [Planctomycetota bacterium]